MRRKTYLELLAKYGVDGAHPGGLPQTRKLLKELCIEKNTKLLDLGCGTGQTLAYIARTYPCKAVGVDISEKMLQKASERFQRENLQVRLVHADITRLPFPPGTFDVALSESATIFTIIQNAFKEYARVLKPGGTLAAVEMAASSPLDRRDLDEIRKVYGIEQVPAVCEWESMLKSAGFKDIIGQEAITRPSIKLASIKMAYDFLPHINTINHYGSKLKYMVFRCVKE